MSSVQVLVFRAFGDVPLAIAPAEWDAFCRGDRPLPCSPVPLEQQDDLAEKRLQERPQKKLNVLLLTLRDHACELVEPLTLDVDEHGFLQRLHVSFAPLPSAHVLDARASFLGRYLRHANRWEPSATLVARALRLANAAPVGAVEPRG